MALTGLLPVHGNLIPPGVPDNEDGVAMPADLHLLDHFVKVVARQDAIEKRQHPTYAAVSLLLAGPGPMAPRRVTLLLVASLLFWALLSFVIYTDVQSTVVWTEHEASVPPTWQSAPGRVSNHGLQHHASKPCKSTSTTSFPPEASPVAITANDGVPQTIWKPPVWNMTTPGYEKVKRRKKVRRSSTGVERSYFFPCRLSRLRSASFCLFWPSLDQAELR